MLPYEGDAVVHGIWCARLPIEWGIFAHLYPLCDAPLELQFLVLIKDDRSSLLQTATTGCCAALKVETCSIGKHFFKP